MWNPEKLGAVRAECRVRMTGRDVLKVWKLDFLM